MPGPPPKAPGDVEDTISFVIGSIFIQQLPCLYFRIYQDSYEAEKEFNLKTLNSNYSNDSKW